MGGRFQRLGKEEKKSGDQVGVSGESDLVRSVEEALGGSISRRHAGSWEWFGEIHGRPRVQMCVLVIGGLGKVLEAAV